MTDPRKPTFDAIRAITRPGLFNDAGYVTALDNLLDAFGAPREGQPATASVAQIGLTAEDFARAAATLGCTVAQIRAVDEVESGGGWFEDVRAGILDLDGPGGFIDGPNLPKILFEAHKFSYYTGGKYDKLYPAISSHSWNSSLYVGGQGEWARLYRAMQLDHDAALKSASVGRYQIMGFNYALAGYSTVGEFWESMKENEGNHLSGFVAYVKNAGLLGALRQISNVHADCIPFGRGYNGAGYAAIPPGYHVKLARAHKKWST